MNFRKLLTYLTVGTAAVIPFAGAQNPTILQGNYISNVFGNSNFVLNPNAQTNIANVTNATRSTTTPLVATSEFTLSLASGANATWTLRAFDGGMKGQNCEARFTYRGFATATTKAEIVQNSLVVASLTLTPTTDPRIASINFPCGDLANLTTFRIAQTTANMTGTNEIGGIYVGLATNMANVAQAENLVTAVRGTAQSIPSATKTTFIFNSETLDQLGEYDPTTGIYTAKRSGRYLVTSTVAYTGSSWTVNNIYNISIMKNGADYVDIYNTVMSTGSYNLQMQVTQTVELVTGDTLKIGLYHTRGSNTDTLASSAYNILSISRFPSSSELVVTPERQNTFAGVKFHTSVNSIVHSGGTAPTGYTILADASFASNVTRFGKAAAPLSSGCSGGLSCSANDFGFSVPNLPIGSYSVRVNGLLNAGAGTTVTECSFQILEATTLTSVGKQSQQDNLISGTGTRDYNASYAGVFVNTSVATRNFIMRAEKVSGSTTGACQANASATRDLYMELIPLDQPSNSALYVQGPVLAAATGAAIPAGYVGQVLQSKVGVTNISSSNYTNLNTVTLTNGVWLCSTQSRIMRNGATVPTNNEMVSCIGNSASSGCNVDYSYQTIGVGYQDGTSTSYNYRLIGSKPTVVRYDGTNFTFADGTVSASATGTLAHKVYADATAGQLQAYGFLECVRLN